MTITPTTLNDCFIIEPKVFADDRGYFLESFSEKKFIEAVCDTRFVQDNESKSSYGVLRGLHFQKPPFAQSKLVRVIKGAVLDVAVDMRRSSSTFGKSFAVELTEDNKKQLFIPRGFAHGFVVLQDDTIFQYKCDNYYAPESEGGILWNDPELNIDWKVPFDKIILSEKDKKNPLFREAFVFEG
ncbi:dTDP-4-dehydrorhamnose 3,5-epimerase [Haoranjiania flava]|uniref:dTDP-4-dehydrorhamnose 3,5-epimerase n=1 Tax=Haoranjiania flava TaxID=1856322 RepID=A0AAE3IMG6_9BACT|nr:dTDP-4-dehydrorhamnose 3,5-epimerase [Haoranjiania flava]MCU7694593.1 dTDP-4-dehydrorhamnose 3,5-epimerase [Haoranjiania flava]